MDIKSILTLASSGVGLVNSLIGQGKDPGPATSVLGKGLAVAKELVDAGENAAPAIEALTKTFGGDKTDVTQAELDQAEQVLDDLIDEFNVELPD